jgi:hypothetical protein
MPVRAAIVQEFGTLAQQKKSRRVGRPKLPKGEAKGRIVPVRFTAQDLEAMSLAARSTNKTVSELVRTIVRNAFEWAVDCKSCGKEFTFRPIDENHPRKTVNNMPINTPPKPPMHGTERKTCPHCNSNAIYKSIDLRFKANSDTTHAESQRYICAVGKE